jgi:hypothetical protein
VSIETTSEAAARRRAFEAETCQAAADAVALILAGR